MKTTTLFLSAIILFSTSLFAQPSFTVDTAFGCTPLTVNFTNTSSSGSGFSWNFNDGSPIYYGYHASHTFQTGNHWVSLSSNEGDFNIEINVIGADRFDPVDASQFCVGEEIDFYFPGPCSYTIWDFGDGVTDTSSHNHDYHAYNTPGVFNITLIVDGECGLDTVTQTLEITNTAIPLVEIERDNGSLCPGEEVAFNSQYFADSYYWDFDDGTTSTEKSPHHVFNTLGQQKKNHQQ